MARKSKNVQVEIMPDPKPKSLSASKHDIGVEQYATISGIKGKQFGKDVFTAVLPFKDLVKFLEVFPSVQRELNRAKVNSIRRYTLSGVEEEDSMRFFPGITCTARGNIFYDENTNKVAVDTKNSKLSLNDGQHRFFGVNEAIRDLQGRINKSKDQEEIVELQSTLRDLKEMVIPIVIFSNLSEREEKQLFHDANQLASRPSRSATIRLAQTDLLSSLAREISDENTYLVGLGVEYDKGSIQPGNPNRILLTTIYASIKLMFRELFRANRNELNKGTYQAYKKNANETFTKIFEALPQDIKTNPGYILDKSYAMKGIASFINHGRYVLGVEDETIIWEAIGNVDWTANPDYWKNYNGIITKRGHLSFGGSGDHGRIAVMDALLDQLPAELLVRAKENKKLAVKAPEGQTELVLN